jgi:hypothetical protein
MLIDSMTECPDLRNGRGSGWGKPFFVNRARAERVLARGQRWKQDGPVDFREAHRPCFRAAVGVKAERARRN